MTEEQKKVLEFHKEFGIAISSTPCLLDNAVQILRHRLILEELEELTQVMSKNNTHEVERQFILDLYAVFVLYRQGKIPLPNVGVKIWQ